MLGRFPANSHLACLSPHLLCLLPLLLKLRVLIVIKLLEHLVPVARLILNLSAVSLSLNRSTLYLVLVVIEGGLQLFRRSLRVAETI